MYSPVTSVLIGDGTNSALYSALTTANIAAGDLAVVNRQGAVLQAAATPTSAAGNDVIYILQGLSTGRSRKSKNIQAKNITSYTVSTYAAPVQQVVAIGSNGTDGSITAVNSSRYKLTIKVKNSATVLPNQEQQYVFFYDSDASATQDEIATNLVAQVNASRTASSLFTAAVLTETANRGIQLTGKAVPADSYGINRYEFLTFDAYLSYQPIATYAAPSAGASTIRTTTTPVIGKGGYAEVFDLWKDTIHNLGYTNWTEFPVAALPAGAPVVGATYDLINIYHFDSHPGDLQKPEATPIVTCIAVPTGSAQATALLAVLDPYISAAGVDKK
jgi:hypothetical protein